MALQRILLIYLLLVIPAFASAALVPLVPCHPEILKNSNGDYIYDSQGHLQFVKQCTFCSLFQLFQNVFNFITWTLAMPVAVVTFIIGGLMLMLGGASTTSRTRALSIIRGTLWGLLIILLSWVLVKTTINLLAGSDQPAGFPWPWNNVSC